MIFSLVSRCVSSGLMQLSYEPSITIWIACRDLLSGVCDQPHYTSPKYSYPSSVCMCLPMPYPCHASPCCYVNHQPTSIAQAWLNQCQLMVMQFVLLKPVLAGIPYLLGLLNKSGVSRVGPGLGLLLRPGLGQGQTAGRKFGSKLLMGPKTSFDTNVHIH